MTPNNQQKFHLLYQAGKEALEKGQYRLSIENLEAARELVSLASRRGGEVQIWLVTAYQAANKITEAVALCKELATHADLETRQQAQRLLYIIQAPRLNRPREWMSEIPDLANADSAKAQYVTAKKNKNHKSVNDLPLEEIDLSQVNTQDNQFIWIALLLVILTLGSLVWLA
ncbi:MAG: tetratricopeptide repeat protein [Pleurocapsa sp.]